MSRSSVSYDNKVPAPASLATALRSFAYWAGHLYDAWEARDFDTTFMVVDNMKSVTDDLHHELRMIRLGKFETTQNVLGMWLINRAARGNFTFKKLDAMAGECSLFVRYEENNLAENYSSREVARTAFVRDMTGPTTSTSVDLLPPLTLCIPRLDLTEQL